MGLALGSHIITGAAWPNLGQLAGAALGGIQVWPDVNLPTGPVNGYPEYPWRDSAISGIQIPDRVYSTDMAKAYQFPNLDGTGVTIGIIALSEIPDVGIIQQFCRLLGVDPPAINIISTDGTTPVSNGAGDGECMVDCCVVAPVVPGATINVYWATNVFATINNCIQQALAECDVVACSWGTLPPVGDAQAASNPYIDSGLTAEYLTETENIVAEARSRGVSFFAASGDSGSDIRYWPAAMHAPFSAIPGAQWPSCCPSVVSVGATGMLRDSNGIRVEEYVKRYSSGGLGFQFAGAWAPTVVIFGDAGAAPPDDGFGQVNSLGNWGISSSTSGANQLMAALHVLLVQQYGSPFDFLKFALANPDVFYDITTGSNGAYFAWPGRDLASGLGSPNVPAMLTALETWGG